MDKLKNLIKKTSVITEEEFSINEFLIENLSDEEKKQLLKVIKDIIPTSIKKIRIPLDLLDTEVLSEFKNLEELHLGEEKKLEMSNLKDLEENTTIKKIYVSKCDRIRRKALNEKGYLDIGGKCNHIIYKDIDVFQEPHEKRYSTNIYVDNIQNDLPKVLSKCDEFNLDIVPGNICNKERSEGFSLNIDTKNKVINCISFNSMSTPSDIRKYLDILKDSGYELKNITWSTENKSYDDIGELLEVADEYDINVNYNGAKSLCKVDDFTAMRASIDWYKELVSNPDLSKGEQIMNVYDIVKSFEYKDIDKEKFIPDIDKSLKLGHMVCINFANLFSELLNEMNVPNKVIRVEAKDDSYAHSRNILRVDDDKYNIHGIFVADPTWDCSHNLKEIKINGKTIIGNEEYLKNNYTEEQIKNTTSVSGIALYNFFLVPLTKYEEVFPKDEINSTIEQAINVSNNEPPDRYLYNFLALDYFAEIDSVYIQGDEEELISKYLTAKKPSLDTFSSMLYNVRLNEGYSPEEATKDVDKVVSINQAISGIRFFNNEEKLVKTR